MNAHLIGERKITARRTIRISGKGRPGNKQKSAGSDIVRERRDFVVPDRLRREAENDRVFGRAFGSTTPW